jgi:hypothetical protein
MEINPQIYTPTMLGYRADFSISLSCQYKCPLTPAQTYLI